MHRLEVHAVPDEPLNRQLAAIIVADIVGYSRLIEAAEIQTLKRVKLHQEQIWQPIVLEFGGRIFKFTGDGFLAVFRSAVAALDASLKIQDQSHIVEATSDPRQRLQLRIGINLGDVV